MKYENFDKAKSLVEGIRKHLEVLDELKSDNVSVRLQYGGNYTILTIGTWDSCEHELRDAANNFRIVLITYYEAMVADMKDQLETL
jgi:hypothetical protein